MGTLKDLGTDTVFDICPATGYPRTKHGSLLNPISHRDGSVIPEWNKPGTSLVNFTNPYGRLYFAHGSGDDFYCFDYATINAGPLGKFIILDSTINSETGSFIQGADYHVLPINTEAERKSALRVACRMVGDSETWVCDNEIRATKSGWNQDSAFFARSVAKAFFEHEFQKYSTKAQGWIELVSERQMRFGGKTVDAIMERLVP